MAGTWHRMRHVVGAGVTSRFFWPGFWGEPSVSERNQHKKPDSSALTNGAQTTVTPNHSSSQSERPIVTREQLRAHTTPATGIWTSYGDRVYDITTFVENHPGGTDRIMMAAGQATDPYWKLYPQHTQSEYLQELLPQLEIGRLDPTESESTETSGAKSTDRNNLEDPYRNDPVRHPALHQYTERPCNAASPVELLLDNWYTPNELWYVRNHHPVPQVSLADYQLQIYLPHLPNPLIYQRQQLKDEFKCSAIDVTLSCGGNRRSEYNQSRTTSGTPWNSGAISNARWSGVRLTDLLRRHGINREVLARLHPELQYLTVDTLDGVAVSIPIHQALDPLADVLLAYQMK